MKINLLASFIAISVVNGFSQTIPNSGFENWTDRSITLPVIGSVGYQELDGWKTTNIISAALGGSAPVVKSTDSYTGTYSLRVGTVVTQTQTGNDTVSGVLSTSFKVKVRPTSLTGYYKSSLKGFKDSIGIIASAIHVDPITKLTTVIGTTGFLIDKNKSNFTDFNAPFIYTNQTLTIDSVAILIVSANAKKANKTPDTFIWLDDLSLQFPTPLSVDRENISASNVNVFPNPASGVVSITYNGDGNAETEILNENGLIVKKISQLTGNSTNIDLSDLESGVYYVKITSNNIPVLRKLVVQ